LLSSPLDRDWETEQEDIEEITKLAKGFGITVSEALNDSVIKAKMDERIEKRNTAQASNTSGGRRSSAKVSDATLLANASKGIMPTSDADLERLIRAKKSGGR